MKNAGKFTIFQEKLFLVRPVITIYLSVEDYNKWLALQKLAKEAGALNSITKNFNTDKAFDEAIDKLVAFEKEHHLEGK